MQSHWPFFITRLGSVMRQLSDLYHGATRVVEMGLYHLQMSPHNKRRATKRSRPGALGEGSRFSSRRARPLLIHYHIFKNAGTSFEWALQQVLDTHVRSYDSPVPNGILSANDIINYLARTPEAEVICSHQAVLPPPRIRGREVFSSILIRDPLARIRSIYAFERRQGVPTPGASKARELDFKRYVEWRLSATPAMLCNFQTYFCWRSTKKWKGEPMGEFHLQKAIANLDRINIVGTVERYEEWLALAQSILSKAFPNLSLSATRQNVSSAGHNSTKAAILDALVSDLGRTLAEQLLANNELDMCLHQIADALLTRRLAEEGVGIALLNAYAEARGRLSGESITNSSAAS